MGVGHFGAIFLRAFEVQVLPSHKTDDIRGIGHNRAALLEAPQLPTPPMVLILGWDQGPVAGKYLAE